MSNVDVVRDAPRRPTLPIDESVRIPDSVKRASQAAEAIHAQAYTQPVAPAPAEPTAPPAAVAPAEPVAPAPADTSVPVAEPPAVAAAEPAPTPPVVDQLPTPTREDMQNDTWAGRYNSMKGRYEQLQVTVGHMQEQMSQMADEITRLHSQGQQPAPVQPSVQPAPQHIRQEDVDNYGTEMVDMARRAALDAVSPQLNALQTENAQLKQTVQRTANRGVIQQLADAHPNWRQINDSAQFKQWIRLRDVYSGAVKLQLLNEAYRQGDASRVISFFDGFLKEFPQTGPAPTPAPQTVQPAAPQPAPRQAAVPLDVLAAPGRARPAPGQTEVPADKPVFTRADIKAFYDNVRAGRYAGREAQKAADEQAIYLAQREGRVRG